MHKIKEKLMDALYECEEKMGKAPGGKISAGELQEIHMITDTIKNIDKIEMLEDGGESYDDGMSGARGGRHYVRGHYSRDDGMSRRGCSEDGSSYGYGGYSGRRHRDSMGRYSRDGGAKEHMIRKMEEMMDEAESEKEKNAMRACIRKLEEG